MKNKLFFLVLSTFLLFPLFVTSSTDPETVDKKNTATLHLVRPQDVIGNRQVFHISSNHGHEFMLKHDSFQQLEVSPGLFSLEMIYGFGIKETFSLHMEPGKSYYLVLTSRPDVLATQPFIVDITKHSFERQKNQLVKIP